MTYACLSKPYFHYQERQLLPIRHQDMPLIKRWRNEQMRILRQTEPLTDEGQELYFRQVLLPSFSIQRPEQLLFSFLKQGNCIGYGGMVHIEWTSKRAEVSFLLETELSHDEDLYRQEFSFFLQMIKEVAFQELRFHRLYTETFDIRPLHLNVLEENGFIFEGRMKGHVRIENQFIDSLIHGCVNEKLEE